MTELNEIRGKCNSMGTSSCCNLLGGGENVPIEYFSRFSLFVLDIVRKLQKNTIFEMGVEKCHIIEYLKHQPFIDGDIVSQVSTALRDLENYGYLMHFKNGYKTLGPYAKLCSSKTSRQRRFTWKKLEMSLYQSSSDLIQTFSNNNNNNRRHNQHKNNRRSKSESNFLNSEPEQNNSYHDQAIVKH